MKTVMVVDDDPAMRHLVHITVSGSSGYHVREAEDGVSAIRLAQREPIDLALLDVAMPGLDGVAVCQVLKALPAEHRPIVIMLTAHASNADQASARAAGADGFVAKPFSPAHLLDTLDRALSTTRHAAHFA